MSSAHPISSSKPLAGRRVLVTRAAHQAPALTALLEERGASVIEIPVIEIALPSSYAALDVSVTRIAEYDWLILTSVNGVEALFARLSATAADPASIRKLKICAIGPATRAALEERGLQVALMPERYVAESVVAALSEQVSGKRVLLVRAAIARDIIPDQLRRSGATVDVVEAYRTLIPAGSAARLQAALGAPQRPHAITFTSSSTVRNLVDMLSGPQAAAHALQGIALASIGPVTSATLREFDLQPTIEAAAYTMPGLADAIAQHFSKD